MHSRTSSKRNTVYTCIMYLYMCVPMLYLRMYAPITHEYARLNTTSHACMHVCKVACMLYVCRYVCMYGRMCIRKHSKVYRRTQICTCNDRTV